MMHSKCMNVIMKPNTGYLYHVTTARSYGVLKPGVGKVDVCLQNHSTKLITVPKQTAMGEIAAAIAIPALLTPKPNESGILCHIRYECLDCVSFRMQIIVLENM